MNPFILGIIPARGGSKGIPGKNIINLGDRPLITYTIDAASGSSCLDDFIVSTDSDEIAEVARRYGASVPFLRPPEFATDLTPTIEAVKHTVSTYEIISGKKVDAVVLLQPTSPFRTSKDIDSGVNIFLSEEAASDSLISCYRADRVHPGIMYRYSERSRVRPYLEGAENSTVRRQEFEKLLVRNGALYITSVEYIFKSSRLISDNPLVYVMSYLRSLNIDELDDLKIARLLIEEMMRNCE